MGKILGILGVVGIVIWAGVASAAIIEVNQTTGNDPVNPLIDKYNGGGPYKTIQAALNYAESVAWSGTDCATYVSNNHVVEITDSATYNEGLKMSHVRTLRGKAGQKPTIAPDNAYPGGENAAIWIDYFTGNPCSGALYTNGDSDRSIENLIIDAKGLRTGVWITGRGVPAPINWVAETRIKDCEIRNSKAGGDPWNTSGVNTTIDSVVIENCNIHDCDYGVRTHYGSGSGRNIEIVGGTISDSNYGVLIQPYYTSGSRGHDVLLDGVTVTNCFATGVGLEDINGVEVNNCELTDNAIGSVPLWIVRSTVPVVSNTTVSRTSVTGTCDVAVYLLNDTDGKVINSNILNYMKGIRTYDSSNLSVKDTVITLVDSPCGGAIGIHADSSGSVTVEGCTFFGLPGAKDAAFQNILDGSSAVALTSSGNSITATDCIIDSLNLGAVAIGGAEGNLSISNTAVYGVGMEQPWVGGGTFSFFLAGGDLNQVGGYGYGIDDISSIVDDGGNYWAATEIDPEFYSTTPGDDGYLYLSCATPDSVYYGASDGGYMGALRSYALRSEDDLLKACIDGRELVMGTSGYNAPRNSGKGKGQGVKMNMPLIAEIATDYVNGFEFCDDANAEELHSCIVSYFASGGKSSHFGE